MNHAAAKHFRISQAFIRNMSDNGVIRIEKVDSSLNGANIFTKALAKESFTRHRLAIMGPQECPR